MKYKSTDKLFYVNPETIEIELFQSETAVSYSTTEIYYVDEADNYYQEELCFLTLNEAKLAAYKIIKYYFKKQCNYIKNLTEKQAEDLYKENLKTMRRFIEEDIEDEDED